MIFEKALNELIRQENIKYILLSPQFPIYNHYFSASPKYEKIAVAGPKGQVNRAYYLYRVKRPFEQEGVLPLFITNNMRKSFRLMREEMPDKYRIYQKMFSLDFGGLTLDDRKKILEN